MKLLVLALLAVSSSAFASSLTYDLKIDLFQAGKLVGSLRLIVREGEPASITQEDHSKKQFIEVIVTEGRIQNHQGILIKFKVGTISPQGERTILAIPQILAREGQPAKITQSSTEPGAEDFALSVIVKRTTL